MTNARTLTEALGGRWHGSYGLAFCPAHRNTRTPALSLSDGAGGRLLARCHAGCRFPAIADALRSRGLLDGGVCAAPDPAELARRRAEEQAEAEKRGRQAQALWREAGPISGTIAEAYLLGRGITCALPDTLRFHPSCWHKSARRFPALVARVDGAEGFAVHRTYLAPDGPGKAEAEPAKAMLGAVKGGAVRLTDGPGTLVVAEGVETALSLACGLLRAPATIWAALSTSGMRGLRLPARPQRLTIAHDGDVAGRYAAHILAERAHALGWAVSFLPAPSGRDWNDVLRMKGGDA
ncbi:toprim domain-containing protein [Defluviimonas sp. WL0024]|uniref:Toprim domain-containing protein n=1 Tax=Albidovulum salinarum TaxID=2984153 RepID=A0ABT2WYF7_9RHOB|nr:toprim domain-containing protein [Defluviimonas sp. WL0024]MCU9846719.1 toprim domain-containing protein [Defluviimonas sp. WL0024]